MRVKILGVRFDVITACDLVAAVEGAATKSKNTIILSPNLHGTHVFHRDEATRSLHQQADIVYIDGMPIIWWGQLMGLPLSRKNRMTFVDYHKELFSTADDLAWRVFYLGGRSGVAETAAAKLIERHKSITIRCHHGYFDGEAGEEQVISQIRQFRPHLLLVGLGMPRQEQWILRNQHHFSSTAIIAVGAGFDYIAGEIAMPSRVLSSIGLEWACRLAAEPRRLAYRYLIEPWFLLPHAAQDILRYRVPLRTGASVDR
jgi:N-acetylglucosaminyldiphosphoundecaprenol N-acetyl-beta-D-mannosaminyltransferase